VGFHFFTEYGASLTPAFTSFAGTSPTIIHGFIEILRRRRYLYRFAISVKTFGIGTVPERIIQLRRPQELLQHQSFVTMRRKRNWLDRKYAGEDMPL
jgi:hypothetical protein